MAELHLNDQLFTGAEQPEIDKFMNNLAGECGGQWEPTSTGYRLVNISTTNVDVIKNTIDERVKNELGIGED